ncbi:hypothetical protein OHV05_36090 (plasmid) [Kitasatospora sp. NBC_00070]|uniref:hypothetical protein n=1 Tax=Kitasatospora sp. NBC_00070 TaxID=2975962 RepID=UPI00324933C3
MWQPWLHAPRTHPSIALLRPAGSIRHRQYLHPGELVLIDLGLVVVVPRLWGLGIDTFASCEAANGPDRLWAYCMVDEDRTDDACDVLRQHGEVKAIKKSAPVSSPWISIEWQWASEDRPAPDVPHSQ